MQYPLRRLKTLLFFDDEYHAHANCNFFGLKVVGEPESPPGSKEEAFVLFNKKTSMPVKPEPLLAGDDPGSWRTQSTYINSLQRNRSRRALVEAGDAPGSETQEGNEITPTLSNSMSDKDSLTHSSAASDHTSKVKALKQNLRPKRRCLNNVEKKRENWL